MKPWKLCLLALVPGALGWLSNVLLARVIFLPLPAALVNLLTYAALYLPTVAAAVFCLWLGRRCGREQYPFPKYLLCTQWPSAVSLILYIWQFHFVSDEARSTLLAMLGQVAAVPMMPVAARLTWLLDMDNAWAQAESLLANIFSLTLLAALSIAGYWWGRRLQRGVQAGAA